MEKMTLRQAIERAEAEGLKAPFGIEYRITLPERIKEKISWDTILFGYCHWDGTELTPLDQDDYSLKDEIISYEVFDVPERMAEFEGEKALSVTVEGEEVFKS